MHCFQVVFHLFKKVSKEKRDMLDGTKTQSDGRNTEVLSNKMAKLPWVHGRGLDKEELCNSSKGRQMVNAWTKEALEHL